MRIGIDLTALQPVATGVDLFLVGMVEALAENPSGLEYVLFVPREEVETFRRLPEALRVVGAAGRDRGSRLRFQQLALPRLARRLRLDVVHSPAFLMPLRRGGARHVLTVYDLTILTLPRFHDRLHRSLAFRAALRLSIARADRICAPTRAVAREIEARFPRTAGRVRLASPGIPAGISRRPPAEVEAVTRRLGVLRPYLLYVGTLEPRKNLRRLVAAFRRLRTEGFDLDLVLAGRLGWDAGALLDDLSDPRVAARIHRLGYVARDDLAALYSGARLFVYPSLAEGFGFPPLEAMSCGAPVVASSDPALAENLGGAAELVDPHDAEALVVAMTRVLGDETRAARLREQGLANATRFTWRETARATVATYRELALSRPATAGEAGALAERELESES